MADVNALVQSDWKFQANLYNSSNVTRRWLHRRRETWITERISQSVKGGAKVAFDCGIGSGFYTCYLVSFGVKVIAIDINASFLEQFKDLERVDAFVADISIPAGVGNTEFADLAVCSEVLEHVKHPSMALLNLYRSLKPGGILILTTPQRYSTTELIARCLKFGWVRKLARLVYGEPVDELGHISLMTDTELIGRIEATGFEIVEQDRFAFYLPIIGEFGGKWGQRLLSAMESGLRAVPAFRWLLWTQAYVLRRPNGS
jgi:2-polyprenyl-3-methyl-5-hydroxy-6-metoxy-1,4-benzoquinol methylase